MSNLAYTFNKKPDGNIEIFENGVRIATASEAYAKQAYGYSATPTPTLTPTPTPTPTYAGLSNEQIIAQQQAIAQKERDRQTWIQAGKAMQGSGSGNATMQNWLNTYVPAEFRNDVAQAMNISLTTTPTSPIPPELVAFNQQMVNAPSPTTPSQYDSALVELLKNPNLTEDQKKSFQLLYDIIYQNDADKAKRLAVALDAATTYSAPLFKAQTLMYTTALQEGLSSLAGNYDYQIKQKQNILNQLTANIDASKDYLDFTHTQELQKLAKSYQKDIETTQENMAATGFTASTRRLKAEQLLTEQNQGLVQSSNRQFTYETGKLERQLGSSQATTGQEISYLQDEATQKRIAALREAEAKVGTFVLQGLPNYGSYGYTPVGGVGGEMPREQYASNLEFAKSFIF